MKPKSGITVVFDRLVNLLVILAAILLVFTGLIVNFEVVARYFFKNPQEWVMPATEFSLFCITFLTACWLLQEDRHVSLDLVVERVNQRTQSLLRTITSIIGAIVCLIILWYSAETIVDHAQRNVDASMTLRIPKASLLVLIPVSMFLLFVQFLRRAYTSLKTWQGLANRELKS